MASAPVAEILPSATPTSAITKTVQPALTPISPDQTVPPASPSPIEPFLNPLFTSAAFGFASWLPQGDWLAFLAMSPEDVTNSPAGEGYQGPPPGTVHFYNAGTGEYCQYEMDNDYGLELYRWSLQLPDGRLAVLTRDGRLVALDSPCAPESARVLHEFPEPIQEVLGSNRDDTILYLSGEQSCYSFNLLAAEIVPFEPCTRFSTFSPDEHYLAVPSEEYLTPEDIQETFTIVEIATGKVAGAITRPLSDRGVGSLTGPTWINESQFLIYRSDEGPLIVTMDQPLEVLALAPTFFQVQGNTHQYAEVQGDLESGYFHLLFFNIGEIQLYHSEDHSIEVLPFTSASFTLDGLSLDLWQRQTQGGSEEYQRYERPLDPPGNSKLVEVSIDSSQAGLQSPDGKLEVRLEENQPGEGTAVTLFALPDQSVLQRWLVAADTIHLANSYYGSPYDSSAWSPGDRYLALVGDLPQEEACSTQQAEQVKVCEPQLVEQVLFVLPVGNR